MKNLFLQTARSARAYARARAETLLRRGTVVIAVTRRQGLYSLYTRMRIRRASERGREREREGHVTSLRNSLPIVIHNDYPGTPILLQPTPTIQP